MDVAATTFYAQKRLAQVPGLNKKVEDARRTFERSGPHDKDGQIAAAEARVAKLHDIVPADYKRTAYSDKGGLLSSASKFVSKRLTIESVKAVLIEQVQQATGDGSQTDFAEADTTAGPVPVQTSSSNDTAAVSAVRQIFEKADTPVKDNLDAEATSSTEGARTSCTKNHNTDKAACGHGARASHDGEVGCTIEGDSSAPSRSKLHQQKQQQLAMADQLFEKIDCYVAHEEATLRQQLQQQQQQQQYKPTKTLQSAADTNSEGSSATEATKYISVAESCITADDWTPELMASLALRFQEFGLPPGASAMPELDDIIKEVRQQELKEAFQKQQQEQQWRLLQQQKQQARHEAATRHLQLYQLGVQQQRARLDRNKGALGRQVGGSVSSAASAPLREKQPRKSSQQHSMQQQALAGEAVQQQDNKGLAQIVSRQQQQGVHSAVAAVDGTALGAAAAQEAATASDSSLRPTVKFCDAFSGVTAAGTSRSSALPAPSGTEASHDTAAAPAKEPYATNDQAACGCRHSSQQAHSTAASATPQHPVPCRVQQATACAAPDAAVVAKASTVLQQGQSPVTPQVGHCMCNAPGVPAGSSHGYLSPAGLKFDHLPGSKRQVYAQIQDALASSNVITAAEKGLRSLTYAPSGAAGPSSS